MYDSSHEWNRLNEDRAIKRALNHFDKKILDMIREDKTISDFEVLKQDIIMNHNRISRIIDERSKSLTSITYFQDEKVLLSDVFECYEHELSESKKSMLDKTGFKSFKFESVEKELELVRRIKQRLQVESD